MSERAEAAIRIKLISPFIFQGVSASAFGIDASLLREGDGEGRVLLPGTLLRGNLRAALKAIATRCPQLITADEIKCWLGRRSLDGTDDEPARGLVQFDDLVATTEEPANGRSYHRIAIEGKRASVRHGALQIVELPWPIGTKVTFEGLIVFFMNASARAKLRHALEVALGRLPALGAFKSIGFGRIHKPELDPVSDVRPLALATPGRTDLHDVVEVALELDRPFLVDTDRVADNVFRGSTVVPGAVIKGAIARRAELAGVENDNFKEALARIVVGHAFPVDRQSPDSGRLPPQPCPLPLSLVSIPPSEGSVQPHRLADVLLADGPCLFGGQAPVFQGWKHRARPTPDPWKACGWPSDRPGHATRIRTAIDGDSWAASEQKLFAHAAVRPDRHLWQLRIARNSADEGFFAQVLSVVEEGIDGIGRTRSRAVCKQIKNAEAPTVSPLQDGGATPRFAVTLQTEALLNDLAALRQGRTLQKDYDDYWRHASGGRLENIRFFARQRFAGGYIATRYRLDPALYDPFLLTEAGSVFLLAGDAADLIEHWSLVGLPLPASLAGDVTWRNCPYLPENGYGSVRVNVVDHVQLVEGADAV